jgi:hypothetical protein
MIRGKKDVVLLLSMPRLELPTVVYKFGNSNLLRQGGVA